MDQRLRELERRFEAQPTPALAEELALTCAQAGACAPPAALRMTARWRPVADLAARWYERPLEDADGCSEEELLAAEARLGRRLPCALREWHRLVGRRLHDAQDRPARLEHVDLLGTGDAALVDVWYESQGAWVVRVPVAGPDDPPAALDHDATLEDRPYAGALSAALLGLLASDTLAAALFGRAGPLGALAPQVRSGQLQGVPADVLDPFAPLPGPGSPRFPPGEYDLRGDGSAVLRYRRDRGGLEWMTATPDAFARLAARVGLVDAGGFELAVRFDRLPRERQARQDPFGALTRLDLRPHLQQVGREHYTAVLSTAHPRATLERIRGALPPGAAEAHLRAGSRPALSARFEPLWPPGASSFDPFD